MSIIDHTLSPSSSLIDLEPINWWESKRTFFNITLILTIFIFYKSYSLTPWEFSEFSALVWIFGANLFYSLSWAFEIYFFRLFKRFPFNRAARISLLIMGIIFSMSWTMINFESCMYSWNCFG